MKMTKLSEWVENAVGKGEIARYEQFLLFPQCFQKGFFPGALKGVIVREWFKFPCLSHFSVRIGNSHTDKFHSFFFY